MTSTIKADVVTAQTTNGDVTLQGNGTGGVTIQGQDYPTAGGLWSGRNMAINGAMQVAQRGASFTGVTGSGTYGVDRYLFHLASFGTWTVTQSTDVPTGQGFLKSLKLDCTTAQGSPGSTAYLRIDHRLVGQDLIRLKKGTANAEKFTISFWVKSTKTGTYVMEIDDDDNNRCICQTYTVSSADTWEKKSLTFVGDTSNALDNDANRSWTIEWWIGSGSAYQGGTLQTTWGTKVNANRTEGISVNLADSTSNDFLLAGVMFECGEVATPFEFEPYAETLQKCQRYFTKIAPKVNSVTVRGYNASGAVIANRFQFATRMRAEPTCSIAGTWAVSNCGQPSFVTFDDSGFTLGAITSSAADTYFYPDGTDDYLTASAEL